MGPILNQPSKFETNAAFWAFFFPALTGMVGYWATVSLNIPDFTRYAVSQRAQILGQAIALPTSMGLFAFIGVVVTSATTIVFGRMIWDPVELAGTLNSPILVTFAMGAVIISTLATNIAANIVSPANDFSNLAPQKIDFRMGGYITGVLGIIILPWKLIADPSGYIFKWLIAYSSLLGPIGGILIADYYFIRKKKIDVDALYRKGSIYWYMNGYNPVALLALLAGIVPNIPGFCTTMGIFPVEDFPVWVTEIYHYAWFAGLIVGGVVYTFFMRKTAMELARVEKSPALEVVN